MKLLYSEPVDTSHDLNLYWIVWGTWMDTNGSYFHPHLGGVIGDRFLLLHVVRHGMEALVYSEYAREAAASTCLAIIFGRIASGVLWLLRSTAIPM